MASALLKTIHVAVRDLGLDDDARRDLQLLVTGKASLTDMTEGEKQAVLQVLKERGFKPQARSSCQARQG
jgi:phage gp16-like protein